MQARFFSSYYGFDGLDLRLVIDDGGNLNKPAAIDRAKKFNLFFSFELSDYVSRAWHREIWCVWNVMLLVKLLTNIADFKDGKSS